jgi:hypothetical protein
MLGDARNLFPPHTKTAIFQEIPHFINVQYAKYPGHFHKNLGVVQVHP